ncbi:hypothetical protein CIG75_15270 [Tumebacillus algifaecis]|uniref:DUF2306 domain-containing protein n=1 Tax=Tumebacillus algifaecis TaxID=1214604 RepID=A0A223D472_9BACL|nr:DUF2306 domain-containing protein [Tumebacillus algifaecis]ASS76164.1 hypothetical protein CIG75_15270 [Tumebacillus algifaecis]
MRKKSSWAIYPLLFVALMWALHTLTKNFWTDPEFVKFLMYKSTIPVGFNQELWTLAVRVHILLAVVAILAGPLGFVKKIRVQRPAIHRAVGKLYIGSVLLNTLPALYVALYATGGWIATAGFFLLNGIWLYSTMLAYRTIRRGQVEAHRVWMIRSYAVTLANNTLYVVNIALTMLVSLDYVTAYVIAVWACWIINLVVAEGYIRIRRRTQSL